MIDFPAAILQIVFGIILLSFYHPFFILYGILLIILMYVVFKYTATKGIETSIKESKEKYKVAHWIQEIARSLMSFKLSGKTQLAMQRNDALTADYLDARENHFKILVIQFIQLIGFKILVTAGLLVIGGLLVLNQQMNIGQFVAAEIIILLLIGSVEKVITGLETFYDVLTSLEKIGQVVDKPLEAQTGADPFEKKQPLKIELEDVSVSTQEGNEILKNLNLTLKANARVFLDGGSGSGKATLLKLLSGLIHPSKGSLYINSTSIEGIWPNKYRSYVSQVLPDQHPFEGTILENITFGDPTISNDRIHDVLKNVGLLQFIKQQPNGLQTTIYPEGQQIPYTISKRIVLARAIVNEPQVLLLKDPLEHFDTEEALEIIKYLTDYNQPWALVVSSRNPIWRKYCPHTITLQNGFLKTNLDA